MADLEPIAMDRAQIRHLEDAREMWDRYDFVMTLQEQFRGAMGWKKVGPHEYLTTYWTDPVTGKKQMNSLGRRSPETEKKRPTSTADAPRSTRPRPKWSESSSPCSGWDGRCGSADWSRLPATCCAN
jgi:hypothetical protein